MNFIKLALPLERAKSWIFCAVCFVLPMNASYIYTLTALLLILWVVEGNLLEKLKVVLASQLCLACVAYFFIYLLAMLWTEDVRAGWRMVARQIPFLLFPLYYSNAAPKLKEHYVTAFIGGICVCALLAHYNFLQLHWFPEWPRGVRVNKSVGGTAPFVDWIMYSPMLALGLYFGLRAALFATTTTRRIVFCIIAALLASNLLFSGGRAGMIMFAALFIALIFEYAKSHLRALFVCFFFLPLTFGLAYYTVSPFAQRVDKGISDIRTFEQNPNTSVGGRVVFWVTTFHVFLQNPIFGVGAGDLKTEFTKVKPHKWGIVANAHNPHNQYLMTAATTGLLGLVTLLYIFYAAARSGDALTKSVLFGFALLCLFESYLWRSNTALAFSVLIASLVSKNELVSKS